MTLKKGLGCDFKAKNAKRRFNSNKNISAQYKQAGIVETMPYIKQIYVHITCKLIPCISRLQSYHIKSNTTQKTGGLFNTHESGVFIERLQSCCISIVAHRQRNTNIQYNYFVTSLNP